MVLTLKSCDCSVVYRLRLALYVWQLYLGFIKVVPNAFYRHLSSRSATGAVINGTGPDGCLPELDMFPLLQVMCLWYMCFCAEVGFFSVLTLYSQWSIVWGIFLFFFSPLFPHVNAVFFLHTLSSCSVYPVVICMFCMYGQVDG